MKPFRPFHRQRILRLFSAVLLAWLLTCADCPVRADEADNASARAYNAAAALQNAGLHTRAAAKWTEFIAQFPGDDRSGQAHYYLAICTLHDQKFIDAVQMFQTVVNRWPNLQQADKAQYNLAMARYELASEAKNADAFRQSAKEFQQVVERFPNSELIDEACYYQADCLFNAGDIPAAITTYQSLISKFPQSPRAARAHYDLGIVQQQIGKLDDAAKTFQALIEKPEYESYELAAECRLRGALCLLELKRYDEAIKWLGDANQKFANHDYRIDAIKLSGQCCFLSDKPADAIRVLTPIATSDDPLKRDPLSEAAYWLGRAQLKLNQPEQALATLEAAIGRWQGSQFISYLQFTRIDALYELPSRRHETPPLYEAFYREHPDHALAPQAVYMAALAYFDQKQYSKARELAEAFLAKPNSAATVVWPDLKYIAAETYLLDSADQDAQHQVAARSTAETLYRDLVAKYPDHARAARSHLRIGWCLYSSDKAQEAIHYLRNVLNRFESSQQLPEAQWLIGQSHAKLNQHQEAITAFNAIGAANQNWPQTDEVCLASAHSYQALNELDQAAAQLQRLVKIQPASRLLARALYDLGELAHQRNQLDQAIQWFKQVAEPYSNSEYGGPAIHALAAIYYKQQQFGQARDWAGRLIDGSHSDELKRRGRYLRGMAFHREKLFSKAIEDLTVYQQQPLDAAEAANATNLLVNCFIAEHQYPAAQAQLNALLAANPDDPNAEQGFYELAHAWRTTEGKSAEAIAAFRWIAEHRPNSLLVAECWFRIAQAQTEQASQATSEEQTVAYKAAETAINKGLEKQPVGVLRENMLYLLGDLQFRQQRFTDAANTLQTQIDEFKTGKYAGPATFMVAQARFQLQQFDAAMPLFVRIGEIAFPDTADEQIQAYRSQALYRAGECAAKLNRWADSQASFQKLIEQFPKFPQSADAQYGIAYALQQQGQLDSAVELYNQITQATETETAAKARFMIGEIKFGQKQYGDAIENFLTVTVGYPYESWQALARFETARCFVELGDKVNAAKTLHEMIEKSPLHPRCADAKRMLVELSQ